MQLKIVAFLLASEDTFNSLSTCYDPQKDSQFNRPRCSSRILIPMTIRMMPPVSSALDLYFRPKTFPILTPTIESVNVMTPMKDTAGTMRTCRKA